MNPTPSVVQPPDQTVCKGTSVAATSLSGTGTTYDWSNGNTAIGLGASATGVLSVPGFTAANGGPSAITGLVTVTPKFTNNSVTCAGPQKTFNLTVNPIPTVSAPSNVSVCDGTAVASVDLTVLGNGTGYNWSNSNTAVGLGSGANGVTSIPSFTASNTSVGHDC